MTNPVLGPSHEFPQQRTNNNSITKKKEILPNTSTALHLYEMYNSKHHFAKRIRTIQHT